MAGTSKKEPRENWSAANQSLAAFLKETKLAKGQKIHIADAKKPHVINLLDNLGTDINAKTELPPVVWTDGELLI